MASLFACRESASSAPTTADVRRSSRIRDRRTKACSQDKGIHMNVQDSTPSHFIPRFDDNGEERDRPISISRPQMPASECRTTQTRNNATENTENSARRTYLPENNKQYYQYHQIVRSKTSYFKIPRWRNTVFYVYEHDTYWVLKYGTFFFRFVQILGINSIQIYSNMSKQRLSKSSECSRKFQRLCTADLEVAVFWTRIQAMLCITSFHVRQKIYKNNGKADPMRFK